MKEIRRRTRRRFFAKEKIRIVLVALRGEASIAELCQREGIAKGLYDSWSNGVPGSWQARGSSALPRGTCRLPMQRSEPALAAAHALAAAKTL